MPTKPPDTPPPVTGAAPPRERRTGPRVRVAIPVMCRYESVIDFVQTQSANISETGMFIETDSPAPVGSKIEFNFTLGDGFTLLSGTAEVMRAIQGGPVNGMGVRFLDLDAANRALIARIVAVNSEEGRSATVGFDFSRPATAPMMPVVGAPMWRCAPPAIDDRAFSQASRLCLALCAAPLHKKKGQFGHV